MPANALQLFGGRISYLNSTQFFRQITTACCFSGRSMKIIYGNRIPANTASMSDVPVALSVSSLISQNMAPPSDC